MTLSHTINQTLSRSFNCRIYMYFLTVLPPVLVPRHSEFAPGHSMLPFNQSPDPTMPHNVSYSAHGFSQPPLINTSNSMGPGSIDGPASPAMSSVSGVPSPGSVQSGPQSPFSMPTKGIDSVRNRRRDIRSTITRSPDGRPHFVRFLLPGDGCLFCVQGHRAWFRYTVGRLKPCDDIAIHVG